MLKVRIYAKWHLRRRPATSRLPSSHSVPLCIQFFLGVLRLLIVESPPKHSVPSHSTAKLNLCNVAYLPLRLCLHFGPTATERVPVTWNPSPLVCCLGL